MPNLLVRVWLPDRPGALGLVASRIGAIGADIVGVDVLERSEHVAVDEFAVVLPTDDLVPLLVREIEEVDGASVEQCRRVERFPDPRLDALESVETVRGRGPPRARAAARGECPQRVRRRLGDDSAWHGDTGVRGHGRADGLRARGAGRGHGRIAGGWQRARPAPTISRSHSLATSNVVLLVGREGHPFRRRERRQLLALARIADRVADILER